MVTGQGRRAKAKKKKRIKRRPGSWGEDRSDSRGPGERRRGGSFPCKKTLSCEEAGKGREKKLVEKRDLRPRGKKKGWAVGGPLSGADRDDAKVWNEGNPKRKGGNVRGRGGRSYLGRALGKREHKKIRRSRGANNQLRKGRKGQVRIARKPAVHSLEGKNRRISRRGERGQITLFKKKRKSESPEKGEKGGGSLPNEPKREGYLSSDMREKLVGKGVLSRVAKGAKGGPDRESGRGGGRGAGKGRAALLSCMKKGEKKDLEGKPFSCRPESRRLPKKKEGG